MEKRKNNHYSEGLKLQIVKEAIEKGANKSAICRKYKIPDEAQLLRWIHIFAPESKRISQMRQEKKITESEEVRELKEALGKKEVELKGEKMRADLYNEMINVAEEELHLKIRKKPGAKQ